MKALTVEVPDRVVQELESMVEAGWFCSGSEAIGLALDEFVRRHPLDLIERFQREDIAWAMQQQTK
jgi:Arc/MetJ-type ribon-helix-helix transcriptional regulator